MTIWRNDVAYWTSGLAAPARSAPIDLGAAGQHLDVLLQRALLDAGREVLGHAVGDDLERQRVPGMRRSTATM